MGDPARARVLTALLGGVRLPAGELARHAGVAASTGSEHLKVLLDAGLVRVKCQGRHRYYALAGDEVAQAVEGMLAIAPGLPVRSLRQHRAAGELRAARTCYDHLAGDLGLRVTDLIMGVGVLTTLEPGQTTGPAQPLPHHRVIAELRLDDVHATAKRPWARGCLDWTGRRPHLAGAVGRHVLELFLANDWVRRRPDSRAVRLTDDGQSTLVRWEQLIG